MNSVVFTRYKQIIIMIVWQPNRYYNWVTYIFINIYLTMIHSHNHQNDQNIDTSHVRVLWPSIS